MTPPAPKKEAFITVLNNPKGMSVEDFFNGLRRQQTKRGKNYSYAPVDPTIYPVEYERPVFQSKDIDALVTPCLPAGKIEIQRCDREQKPSRVRMSRRQALSELLNQAAWNYKSGKNQTFIKAGALHNRIKSVTRPIEKTIQNFIPTNNEMDKYILDEIQKIGAPLIEVRKNLLAMLESLYRLDNFVLKNIAIRKKQRSQSTKKSPNTGDGWYRNLIDDLCKIWVVVFEKDVGIWPTARDGKEVLDGPMLKFIRSIFQRLGVQKSDWTIKNAVDAWRDRYRVELEKK